MKADCHGKCIEMLNQFYGVIWWRCVFLLLAAQWITAKSWNLKEPWLNRFESPQSMFINIFFYVFMFFASFPSSYRIVSCCAVLSVHWWRQFCLLRIWRYCGRCIFIWLLSPVSETVMMFDALFYFIFDLIFLSFISFSALER